MVRQPSQTAMSPSQAIRPLRIDGLGSVGLNLHMVNTLTDSSGDMFWQHCRQPLRHLYQRAPNLPNLSALNCVEELCYGIADDILGWRSAATVANGGHPTPVSTPDPNDTRLPPPARSTQFSTSLSRNRL